MVDIAFRGKKEGPGPHSLAMSSPGEIDVPPNRKRTALRKSVANTYSRQTNNASSSHHKSTAVPVGETPRTSQIAGWSWPVLSRPAPAHLIFLAPSCLNSLPISLQSSRKSLRHPIISSFPNHTFTHTTHNGERTQSKPYQEEQPGTL